MDDLSQQINQILSDPQSMQQIQGILSSLGGMGNGAGAPNPTPAPAPAPVPAPAPAANSGLGGITGGITPEMLSMMAKLGPLLGQVNREDDSTRLLRALRPLLSGARQKKVDEAMKILQMMRLLPLLKESGVFSGLLSGLL